MKKTVLAIAVSVLAVSMVTPIARFVNLSAGKPVAIDRIQYADGWPMPPKPPAANTETFVADGWPMPPKPPSIAESTLVADGWPMPPKPPQALAVA